MPIQPIQLELLSEPTREAFFLALANLPNDRDNPAPLCERVALILDALAPLCVRPDLPEADRQLLTTWAHSDHSLLTCVAICYMLDWLGQ